MPKLMLKSAFITFIGSLLFLGAALFFSGRQYPRQSTGRLVFASTYADGYNLDKIILRSPEGTVTLSQENNFWVVAEADYYYADTDMLNRLLTDFNNATYYSEQPYSPEAAKAAGLADKGTLIQTFSGNKLLNSIIIGKVAENPHYHFAAAEKKKEIWLIDGEFSLPGEFNSWIMQPVSELPPEMIESVSSDNAIAMRETARQPFVGSNGTPAQPQALLKEASYITAENVSSAQDFDSALFPVQRRLTFTTFQGLVVDYFLYTDGEEYWLKVDLSTTPLPKQSVNAYIRDNRIFYDGWFFKIPALQGKLLFSLPII